MIHGFERFILFQDSNTTVGRLILDEKVQPSKITIIHVSRDFNKEAHDLAKRGCRTNTLKIKHLV